MPLVDRDVLQIIIIGELLHQADVVNMLFRENQRLLHVF